MGFCGFGGFVGQRGSVSLEAADNTVNSREEQRVSEGDFRRKQRRRFNFSFPGDHQL